MAWLLLSSSLAVAQPAAERGQLRIELKVETPLVYANTPLDPTIDFAEMIRRAKGQGVLDPNSIEVRNLITHKPTPHALSEDFFYGDQGRIEFVAAEPGHTRFEIRFRTRPERPPPTPRKFVPQVGTGDLLRYNASRPMPISVPYSPGLYDLDEDGRLDLTGTWNYAYRPGWPQDGIICYRRTAAQGFQFADLQRLRYESPSGAPEFFKHTYMAVDFADFDRDGKLDLVMTRRGTGSATFYRNTGKRDLGSMPRYSPAGSVPVDPWQACRAVDLDKDGAVDLVVDGQYLRNQNRNGWPFRAGKPVQLDAGLRPCFVDVDHDGRLDAVCLRGAESVQPDFYRVAWRRNLGGSPPQFGEETLLEEIDQPDVSLVAAWHRQGRSGLIVQHGAFQRLAFYRLRPESPTFQHLGRAESVSAVMSLSDQAWPCLCDWDTDGDQDLLVGGGYGWPRVVVNEGSRDKPAFREAERILADGKPIRFLRNEILGPPHNWHDMGYPYPVFADWDGDGMKDLICPNETNRIFWHRNTGTPNSPALGPRQQILCDGFPDSPEMRAQSAATASDPHSNNGVYPYEKSRPFLWRTGAAVADFNDDGLPDLVTHDGHQRVATLFVQQRGVQRLRKGKVLRLVDGRAINDAIVERRSHWTESFRAVDWNGDGRQDLIYSVAGAHNGALENGSIYLLKNSGTKRDPVFEKPQVMRCFGEPIRITNHGPHPWPGDFDGDGKPDLIACVEWSVYPFYSHAALMMTQRPKYTLTLLK